MLEQERHPVLDLGRADRVVVVEHEHQVVREPAELVEERREDGLDRGGRGASRRASGVPPVPGATVCRARITYDQNAAG